MFFKVLGLRNFLRYPAKYALTISNIKTAISIEATKLPEFSGYFLVAYAMIPSHTANTNGLTKFTKKP